jgi:hypothetical protein
MAVEDFHRLMVQPAVNPTIPLCKKFSKVSPLWKAPAPGFYAFLLRKTLYHAWGPRPPDCRARASPVPHVRGARVFGLNPASKLREGLAMKGKAETILKDDVFASNPNAGVHRKITFGTRIPSL